MKKSQKEIDRVKEQAAGDVVVFLQSWKRRAKRSLVYRLCLYFALFLCLISLVTYWLYDLDNQIPSVIHVRADSEQALNLGIPAKGEIVSVGVQGESNIPAGAVTIDLNQPIVLKTGEKQAYSMQVRLFGFVPIKQVGIQVIEDKELIPVGCPVGIYMETDGILVIGVGEFSNLNGGKCSPAKNILRSGDYIRKLNGVAVKDKEEFIRRIEECGGEDQLITVERDGVSLDLKVKPVQDGSGAYKIGVWVRDNVQGVGTMTYIDADGNFGALGHGINDLDTSTLMSIADGTLYETTIVSVHKGAIGSPGEMTGMIVYSDENILGDITYNGKEGIFGICNGRGLSLGEQQAVPIGLKQEIETGPAQILCTVDGKTRYYDIEITEIHLDYDNVNRGIELRVTDPELLRVTGGIVQGMSGSPILQNDKIVGAVTHVLINDPERGYGIFIENMLEH